MPGRSRGQMVGGDRCQGCRQWGEGQVSGAQGEKGRWQGGVTGRGQDTGGYKHHGKEPVGEEVVQALCGRASGGRNQVARGRGQVIWLPLPPATICLAAVVGHKFKMIPNN